MVFKLCLTLLKGVKTPYIAYIYNNTTVWFQCPSFPYGKETGKLCRQRTLVILYVDLVNKSRPNKEKPYKLQEKNNWVDCPSGYKGVVFWCWGKNTYPAICHHKFIEWMNEWMNDHLSLFTYVNVQGRSYERTATNYLQ